MTNRRFASALALILLGLALILIVGCSANTRHISRASTGIKTAKSIEDEAILDAIIFLAPLQ